MIRSLTLAASLLALPIADASAQRQQAIFSNHTHNLPANMSAEQLRKELRARVLAVHGRSNSMFKTTSGGQRLTGQADYDFSTTPGGAFDDTVVVKYSGNRTSAFDFTYLQYDFQNSADAPGPWNGTGYIHYDSVFATGPTGPLGRLSRKYDANGKVILIDFNATNIATFSYDAQGRLTKRVFIGRNTTSGNFTDSSSRNFYQYNSAGHLVLDSVEYWDGATSTWDPSSAESYTPNASGNPTQYLYTSYFGSTPSVESYVDFVYNAANLPVTIIYKYDDGAGNLVNDYKDTFGYTGNARVLAAGYAWDGGSSTWELDYEETRHLNGASLPDSVRYISTSSSSPNDTLTGKLTYNAQGNPLMMRQYLGKNETLVYETRWYYQNENSGVSVSNIPGRKDLSVYPNPASDMLYVKGQTEGRYTIQNMAGQLLQSGTILSSNGIPLSSLAPGIYSVSLQDKNGTMYTTQFVRK